MWRLFFRLCRQGRRYSVVPNLEATCQRAHRLCPSSSTSNTVLRRPLYALKDRRTDGAPATVALPSTANLRRLGIRQILRLDKRRDVLVDLGSTLKYDTSGE